MFTGIIESLGHIEWVEEEGNNRHFCIRARFREDDPIRVDQSIAHDGVCLTVTEILSQESQTYLYRVTAVQETLERTHLRTWTTGKAVNLERCMRLGARIDGHIVQGHVDAVGQIQQIAAREGSWMIRIGFPTEFAALLVDKGSICVNGVSLTVVEAGVDFFTVTIIPFTWEHTNFHALREDQPVNLEFDILGKYLLRRSWLASTPALHESVVE